MEQPISYTLGSGVLEKCFDLQIFGVALPTTTQASARSSYANILTRIKFLA